MNYSLQKCRTASWCLLAVLSVSLGCGNGDVAQGSSSQTIIPIPVVVDTIAEDLFIPWEVAFSPDGRIFFTEQPGRLRVISGAGTLQTTPVFDVSADSPGGEAGMLGLALDPDFTTNHRMYVVFCTHGADPVHVNCQVARLVENNNSATYDRPIFQWPSFIHHVAGRLIVGPDRLLYLAIGDSQQLDTPQDLSSPYGKVLRMTLEGQAAPGNPFGSLVYAYGFRDPQGLAFDRNGRLYGTDHGDVSNDEVNLIQAGKNYGWPICVGRCNNPDFVDPIRLYFPETCAPSGADFYYGTTIPQWTGSFFHSCLGLPDNTFAKHVHRIKFTEDGLGVAEEEVLYRGEFGRIRDVTAAPDGSIYFSSSNGPGDRILRIRPQ